MNSNLFGKTMENLRMDVRLVEISKDFQKYVNQVFFFAKIFNENLVAVNKIEEALTLNKPTYVWMSILDWSKTMIYYFHNTHINKKIWP